VRKAPWRATHLKTMRAGLFQRMWRLLEPRFSLSTEPMPWDMIAMFAAIEMAGWDRCTHVNSVLAIYNFANSNEWRNGSGEERRLEALVRGMMPFDRIETL
jgi:hypothetical protein